MKFTRGYSPTHGRHRTPIRGGILTLTRAGHAPWRAAARRTRSFRHRCDERMRVSGGAHQIAISVRARRNADRDTMVHTIIPSCITDTGTCMRLIAGWVPPIAAGRGLLGSSWVELRGDDQSLRSLPSTLPNLVSSLRLVGCIARRLPACHMRYMLYAFGRVDPASPSGMLRACGDSS